MIEDATPAMRGSGSSASTVALAMTIAIVNMKAQTQAHSHQNGASFSQAISKSCTPASPMIETPKPISVICS